MLDPKQDRGSQIHQMLMACFDYTERLSDWEKEFVASLHDQYERKGDLSNLQVEHLEKIYYKLP